jgi:diguanylate cyclase (GGDEF)-like protein
VSIFVWTDGLPAIREHAAFTPVGLVCFALIIAVGVASVVALYAHTRFRSVLALWLGVATVCLIADVVLSILGGESFSLGWYVSRLYILVATCSVSIILILQATRVYGQLALTADRLLDESLTDALTGLANRRSFDARLAQIVSDGARTSLPIALLMIDVDNFKLYNDAFGHLAGDDCLRAVAGAIRASVPRERDVVARFGGEELAVVMPETSGSGAAIVAERVRAAVERLELQQSPHAVHAVITVSVGVVACASAQGLAPDDVIAHADRALYLAKDGGRNRVAMLSTGQLAAATE